jgi:hypothetical protein
MSLLISLVPLHARLASRHAIGHAFLALWASVHFLLEWVGCGLDLLRSSGGLGCGFNPLIPAGIRTYLYFTTGALLARRAAATFVLNRDSPYCGISLCVSSEHFVRARP